MGRSASHVLLLAGLAFAAGACADQNPAGPRQGPPEIAPPPVHAALRCQVDVRAQLLACGSATPETAPGVSALIIGGQGTNVRLTSSGTSYDSTTSIFRMDVTVENLMAQALGTTDGVFPAPEGVRVFFHASPTATEGSGEVTVANADGVGVFTGAAQKYFQYAGLLAPGDTTGSREWRFSVPNNVTRFVFGVFVAAPVRGTDVPLPGIVFLQGHNVADTIGAVQNTMLRIGVRGPGGSPAANTYVRVRSVPVPVSPFGFEVQTAALGAPFFTDSAYGVTDSAGTVRVWVRMGRRAGPGRLVVTVPDLSLTDTARYTILPGRATTVRSLPEDTTVLMGGRVPLRLEVRDRYGNAGSDTVAITATGPGTVQGSEVVAGPSIGRIKAVAAVGGARDSSYVRVVPPGTLAATVRPRHSGQTAALYTFSLDGSSLSRVRGSVVGGGYGGQMSVAWLDSKTLVYHDNNSDHTKQLYVVNLVTGVATRFLPTPDQMFMENFPRVSRDGSWVYFGGGTYWEYYVYRARADGTGRERISADPPTPYNEWGADPSPDGTRIVFVKDGSSADLSQLYVMDLGTRQVMPLDLTGVSPRWSPDGTRIAYAGEPERGGMRPPMVANADGTGARTLSTSRIGGDVNWSPDGKYIVAATIFLNEVVVIDVETGAEVLVTFPAIEESLSSLVWKP